MFDSVPPKVQKVALRSGADGLGVESIGLLGVPGSTGTAQGGQPQ